MTWTCYGTGPCRRCCAGPGTVHAGLVPAGLRLGERAPAANVHREFLGELAGRTPLLPGADVLAFIGIDPMQKRIYGHKKQAPGAPRRWWCGPAPRSRPSRPRSTLPPAPPAATSPCSCPRAGTAGMDEPLRGHLRPARRPGLTSPDPGHRASAAPGPPGKPPVDRGLDLIKPMGRVVEGAHDPAVAGDHEPGDRRVVRADES